VWGNRVTGTPTEEHRVTGVHRMASNLQGNRPRANTVHSSTATTPVASLDPVADIDAVQKVIRSYLVSHFPKFGSCVLVVDIGLPGAMLTLDFTSNSVRSRID